MATIPSSRILIDYGFADSWRSGPISNAGRTVDQDEPGADATYLHRPVWFQFSPYSDLPYLFALLGDDPNQYCHIYAMSSEGVYQEISSGRATNNITPPVTGYSSNTLFIRVSTQDDTTDSVYELAVNGPGALAPSGYVLAQGGQAEVLGGVGTDPLVIAAPPARVEVRAGTATVETPGPSANLPITATVSGTAPRAPHLWMLRPDEAEPGTDVTIVGYGLPDSITVRLGELPLAVVSRSSVPASGGSSTEERMISAAAIDAPHELIVVTIPEADDAAVDDLSGPITVEEN